jgi:hypothetical protein
MMCDRTYQRDAHLCLRKPSAIVLPKDAIGREKPQHAIERTRMRGGGGGEIVDRPRVALEMIGHAELGGGPERPRRNGGRGDLEDPYVRRKLHGAERIAAIQERHSRLPRRTVGGASRIAAATAEKS